MIHLPSQIIFRELKNTFRNNKLLIDLLNQKKKKRGILITTNLFLKNTINYLRGAYNLDSLNLSEEQVENTDQPGLWG